MTSVPPEDRPVPEMDRGNEERWRAYLSGEDPAPRARRAVWGRLPSPPRCQLCAVPFGGPFAPFLRMMGRRQFAKNPRFCAYCVSSLTASKGGAVVKMSALFADVRGSTPLAERLGPAGTYNVIDRFYQAGVDALVDNGALVDRFMGDQVVGYFVPLYAPNHARSAIEAGLAILRSTGYGRGREPWVEVGVGVHTGSAYVGTVGRPGGLLELTAIGEDVNVAARLGSAAAPGEIVVTEAAYAASGLDRAGERRELRLKGVTEPVGVRALRLDG